MNRDEIFERVVKSADDFGAGNPQQFQQFGTLLAKCRHEEIFYGLLKVFVDCPHDSKLFSRQELAGRLLIKMKPYYKFDLHTTIKSVLPNYNPSIEQLPYYFVVMYGLDTVLKAFDVIESEPLSEREKACITTMRWWLEKLKFHVSV